jgi:hypothetical protein
MIDHEFFCLQRKSGATILVLLPLQRWIIKLSLYTVHVDRAKAFCLLRHRY